MSPRDATEPAERDAERRTGAGEGDGTAEAAAEALRATVERLETALNIVALREINGAAELAVAQRKVTRVRAQHHEVDTDHGSGMSRCDHCLGWWPCDTIRALDGEA